MRLLIHDNGTLKEQTPSDGLGLSNMTMRAEKIGGSLSAEYADGFRVELVLG